MSKLNNSNFPRSKVHGQSMHAALEASVSAAAPALTPTFTPANATTFTTPVVINAVVSGAMNPLAPWEYEAADMTVVSSFVCPLAPTNNGSRIAGVNFSWQIIFDFDGQAFEILTNSSSAASVRVWANEQVSAYQSIGAVGNSFLKVDFGSRAQRRVIIEADYGFYLQAIYRQVTDSIMAPSRTSPLKYAHVGDSYSVGDGINGAVNQNYGSCQGFVFTLARLLGITKLRMYGQGGTGFLAPNANVGTYRARLADVLSYQPDVVIIQGTQNDSGYTGAALQSEVTTYIAVLRAGLPPTSIIIGLTPFPVTTALHTGNAVNASALLTAYQAAGIPYVDAWTQNWIYGTGKVGATTGDGNADYYQSSNVAAHPSVAGHDYIARRIAAGVGPIMTTGL